MLTLASPGNIEHRKQGTTNESGQANVQQYHGSLSVAIAVPF